MEYVAAGDIAADGVHMLSTSGMLRFAESARPADSAIVATEIGMLYPLRRRRRTLSSSPPTPRRAAAT